MFQSPVVTAHVFLMYPNYPYNNLEHSYTFYIQKNVSIYTYSEGDGDFLLKCFLLTEYFHFAIITPFQTAQLFGGW